MCRTNILKKGGCEGCDVYSVLRRRCDFTVSAAKSEDENVIKKNIATVERWVKANPTMTRQSEFLKQFPNADLTRLQPCMIEKDKRPMWCGKFSVFGANGCCDECRHAYWNEEVTDND